MPNYLVLDTETGGLTRDSSLLSIGLILANEDFKIIEEVELLLKPDNDNYVVCAKALEINGINLIEHNKNAITYREAKTVLYRLLERWSNDGKFKLNVLGKQVAGDVYKIWDNVLQRNTWEQFVSYQQIDVSSVFKFLVSVPRMGWFKDVSGSLTSLCEYYKIDATGQHNALTDCRLTLKVYEKMVDDVDGSITS